MGSNTRSVLEAVSKDREYTTQELQRAIDLEDAGDYTVDFKDGYVITVDNRTGRAEYTVNKVLHREDGPAIDLGHGRGYAWCQNGKLHRDNGPAIEYGGGRKEWYQHGVRHRTDGPAIVYPDGTVEYWVHGEKKSPRSPIRQ